MTVGRPPKSDPKEIARLYTEGELRIDEIATRLSCSTRTVLRALEREGVPLVDRPKPRGPLSPEHKAKIAESRTGKGTGPRTRPLDPRVCEGPLCPLGTYVPTERDQRFCSRQCRSDFFGERARAQAIEDYLADPKRCPCGEAFPYDERHAKTYCSPACRKTYGKPKGPKKDPANYVTFNCERCGAEVTRYRNYGNGALRFCSNECSARSNTQRRIGVDDVVLDSGWEALVWGLCSFHKVSISRFDRAHAVEHGDGWYGPDFVVSIGLDLYFVEVKGLEDDDDRSRYEAWTSQGNPLVVLDRDRLRILMACADRDDISTWLRLWEQRRPLPMGMGARLAAGETWEEIMGIPRGS